MKKENNAIVVTSIISGVILIIAILALTTFSSSVNSGNSVTVQGIANVKATPDLLTIYFSIETLGDTASEASDANNVILTKLENAIVAQGFEKSDLKTQSFNVYPNTYWDGTKTKTEGYKATHSLKIELSSEQFDKISEVVDAGVDSGAGISYINFELTQESQNAYKAQALELASKDAKIKAEAVALGFNKNVGRLISVQVNDFGYYPWNLYTAKSEGGVSADDVASARETAMNLTPSEQDISATISATYKIR